jgi:predicted nucleic acid-binding protein
MIVIDASAMIEALVGREADNKLLDALEASVHAPHLLDVEVLSVLRILTLSRKLPPDAADHARADYFALTIARYEVHGLADRVWDLRRNYTTYDTCYLALAEALDSPLYTCDHKLASDGHRAEVLAFPRTH